uniref:Uncharacterized protein n=1 Tax=Arundo donax TaxID=35708 RepID=A0A0A8YUZ2_ARUDO
MYIQMPLSALPQANPFEMVRVCIRAREFISI